MMGWMQDVGRWIKRRVPVSHALHHADGKEGEVLDQLRGVEDPELHMDIVRLGLIRSVHIDNGVAHVEMTTTVKGCPLARFMVFQVRAKISALGLTPEVEMVYDPPWEPADMEV